jgi:hypothetical protein
MRNLRTNLANPGKSFTAANPQKADTSKSCNLGVINLIWVFPSIFTYSLDLSFPSQREQWTKNWNSLYFDLKQIIFRHCGIRDPSWSELHLFVSFLNKQLQDFEVSAFCGLAAVEDLPGFAKFVLRFLIQMSRVNRSLWLVNDKSGLYVNILGKNQMRFITPNIYKETAAMKDWKLRQTLSLA